MNKRYSRGMLYELIRYVIIFSVTLLISIGVTERAMELSGIREFPESVYTIEKRLKALETEDQEPVSDLKFDRYASLRGKKIVYDGDSIASGRESNGGGYPALIAEKAGCTYENLAEGGARLCSHTERHSVVDNLPNLPADGDLYCFEGGINDFWGNTPLGEVDPSQYGGEYDTGTVCGALETIFTYCLENHPGKPICFVISHKIQNTAASQNANGDTFEDYANAMIAVCRKYSIPYYDAFHESGLNGWNQVQSELYLNGNSEGKSDGIHPNMEGYRRYYVPQLLALFEKIMPNE